MDHFTKTTTKFIYIAFTATLLFLGCKKEDLTGTEWGERAVAKRNEITALGANISCSQKDNVIIQALEQNCSVLYFTILKTDITKYEKLKKEYLELTGKQYAAWHREGLIVEPCYDAIWSVNQPVRLDCINDKVKLVTASDIPVVEARALIITTRQEINSLIATQTCTNEANWSVTGLINEQTMTMDHITFSRNTDYKELKSKVSLYNRLNINIIDSEKKGSSFKNEKLVEKVECVNGKPVIKFKS